MKAWLVRIKDEFSAVVVFAETPGKAKSIGLMYECCEGADFCDIEVRRAPYADKHYTEGREALDWDDPDDRIALVKDCNFICEEIEKERCDICSAKEFCDYYNDLAKGLT